MVSIVFGMFHPQHPGRYLGVAFFVLACHGLVIALLWAFGPAAIDLHIELVQWIVMAAVISWLAGMALTC